MFRYVFAVGKEAYCCWEHDLPERNEQFLSSIDTGYFNYIAQRHIDQIEGPDCKRAAVALRAGYHHGLETLFSLLGALLQAPEAVPAWLPKCNNTTLRELIETLLHKEIVLTQVGPQRVSLSDLAVLVHQYCWPDDQPANITGNRFGLLWNRFAHDFLNPDHIAEYNSIKHGLRVSSGGFTLRTGLEEEYGVPASPANMHTLGASPFGTSFYEAVPVLTDGSSKYHLRIRHKSLNWRAEAMAQRMQLIAYSINNVVSALRCINGVRPDTVQFIRPDVPTLFDAAWDWHVGVDAFGLDLIVDPIDVRPVPRADLEKELKSRTMDGET